MSQTIGHYEIISELGRGGMGVVYKAHEQSLNRFVAIKMLGDQVVNDPNLRARFLREARSAAALSHPNIIQIYFVGEDKGRPFFAMEYVSGVSLAQVIRSERNLSPKRAADILLQAASGLARAHDQGIIHRDIKPGNIMIDPHGLVKLADFGIAHVLEADEKLTATGQFLGTPGYLSPEVCLGKPIEKRSDIFSLGIVYFEMLTGRTPFRSDSPLAMLREVVELAVPDPRQLNAEVDLDSHLILLKMVAKNPDERFSDCHKLVNELKRYLGNGSLGVAPQVQPDVSANSGPTLPVLGNEQPTVRISQVGSLDQPTELITPFESQSPTQSPLLNEAPTLASTQVGAAAPPPLPPMPTGGAQAVTADVMAQPSSGVLHPSPSPTTKNGRSALPLVALVLLLVAGVLGAWYFMGRSEQPLQEPQETVAQDTEDLSGEQNSVADEADQAEIQQVLDEQNGSVISNYAEDEVGAPAESDEVKSIFAKNEAPGSPGGGANKASKSSKTASVDSTKITSTASLTPSAQPKADGAQAPLVPISLPSSKTESKKSSVPVQPKLALAAIGDPLLARPLRSHLESLLKEQGFQVLDDDTLGLDLSRTGIRELGEQVARGGGNVLVYAQVTFLDQRELKYMNTSSTAYKAEITLKCWSPQNHQKVGDDYRVVLEYTSLNAERKAEGAALEAIDSITANLKSLH